MVHSLRASGRYGQYVAKACPEDIQRQAQTAYRKRVRKTYSARHMASVRLISVVDLILQFIQGIERIDRRKRSYVKLRKFFDYILVFDHTAK